MSAYRFLIDENLPPFVRDDLRRLDSSIRVLCIGDEGAPCRGTPDPVILVWLDAHGFCLVTDNRRSMPGHLKGHVEEGGHIAGIFIIRPRAPWGRIVEELHLIWAAADAGEYTDQIIHIPFRPRGR